MPTYKIQFRQDTVQAFNDGNVTLLKGEPAIITDTSTHQKADGTGAFFFIGDGSTAIGSAGGDLKPAGASYVNPAGGANNYAAIDAAVLTGTTTVADLTVQDTDSNDPTVTVKATDAAEQTVIKHDSINCGGSITSLGHSITAGELDIASGATLDVNGTSDFSANIALSGGADLSLGDGSTITTTDGNITTGSGNITTGSGNITSASGHVYVPGCVVQVQHYQVETAYLMTGATTGVSGITDTSSASNLLRTADGTSAYVEVTITPKSTNSILLVEASVFLESDNNNTFLALRRKVGTGSETHPGLPAVGGSSRMPCLTSSYPQGANIVNSEHPSTVTLRYFDNNWAGSLAAVRYRIVVGTRSNSNIAVNRSLFDTDNNENTRGQTLLTVTEIAGSS